MTSCFPDNVSTWLVDWRLVTSWTTQCRRETPTTMMMKTKKMKRTTAGARRERPRDRRAAERR
jgi:hypothetical protein